MSRKRREDQTLFRTGLSPLWALFTPNASDMQAPGLPPRPGAVVFACHVLSHRIVPVAGPHASISSSTSPAPNTLDERCHFA
jgi:hypothetical protein